MNCLRIILFIKPVKNCLLNDQRIDDSEYAINPYDLYCLNHLTSLKKNHDIKIISVMMGEDNAKDALLKASASGSDEVILLSDRKCFSGSDTIATSNVLAAVAKKIGFDCVAFGDKSIDGETGQVKYGVSELLHINHISNILEITDINAHTIRLKRESVYGIENIKTKAPISLSFKGYSLKYENFSLMRLKRARKSPITIWDAKDTGIEEGLCGADGSKTKVVRVSPIVTERKKIDIIGDIYDITKNLKDIIK